MKPVFVIPVKTGIHVFQALREALDPPVELEDDIFGQPLYFPDRF